MIIFAGEKPPNNKAEELRAKMIEIARRFPKPSGRPLSPTWGFGNNFRLLFVDFANPENDSIYLKRMHQRYKNQWAAFIRDNERLMDEIMKVVNGDLANYHELRNVYRDLLYVPGVDKDFVEKAAQEIEFDGIEADVHYKLDPLLGQASEAMKRCGINPVEFYG